MTGRRLTQRSATAPRESSGGSGGYYNVIRKLPQEVTIQVRFLSIPSRLLDDGSGGMGTDLNDNGEPKDWCFWRSVASYNGFAGGIDPFPGLAEFPVFDISEEWDEESQTWKQQWRKNSEDPLLAIVKPSDREKRDSKMTANATDAGAMNVLWVSGDWETKEERKKYNPQPGQHFVLRLNKGRYLDVVNFIWDRIDEFGEENFNPLDVWSIMVYDDGKKLRIKKVPKSEPVDPDEVPELIDIAGTLLEQREKVEAYIEAALAAEVGEESQDEEPEDHAEPDEADEPDEDEVKAPVKKSIAKKGPDYSVMPAARLKLLLKEADVEFSARATVVELRKIAAENL